MLIKHSVLMKMNVELRHQEDYVSMGDVPIFTEDITALVPKDGLEKHAPITSMNVKTRRAGMEVRVTILRALTAVPACTASPAKIVNMK